jgi:capsular polysaccharide transport system permease protein
LKIAKGRRLGLSYITVFWLIGSIPTLFAIAYYGLIATPRYASEATFIVRSISTHRVLGFESLFQAFGIDRAADDSNSVQSYLLSRDAVRSLEQKLPLRAIFGRRDIDALARFPPPWGSDSFEQLYKYYLDRVSVVQEHSKGLIQLRVVAFTPQDAESIGAALLTLAEDMVNKMNERSQRDTVVNAKENVSIAEKRMIEAQRALGEYRDREQMIDPQMSSASVLQTVTALATDLAMAEAQLDHMRATSPDNPAISPLSDHVASLTHSIDAERSKMAGGDSALAAIIGGYEKRALEEKMAAISLTSASAALETAQEDARRQSIYLEPIVSPNKSDESTEPQRLRMIATVFVLSFAVAAVVWLILAGAKEHAIQ